jgi:hypothetical protein
VAVLPSTTKSIRDASISWKLCQWSFRPFGSVSTAMQNVHIMLTQTSRLKASQALVSCTDGLFDVIHVPTVFAVGVEREVGLLSASNCSKVDSLNMIKINGVDFDT